MEPNEANRKEIDIQQLLKHILLYRKSLIKWAITGLIIGIIIAFSIPREYQTTVKIAPEEGSKNEYNNSIGSLANLIGINTTQPSPLGITEKIYPDIISSTPFLKEFQNLEIEYKNSKINLYEYSVSYIKKPWWEHVAAIPSKTIRWIKSIGKKAEPILSQDSNQVSNISDDTINFTEWLRSKISIGMDNKSGIYSISARMQNPTISAIVADSIVQKLQRYMIDYQTSKLSSEIKSTESLLEAARTKYYDTYEAYTIEHNRTQYQSSPKVTLMHLEQVYTEKEIAFAIYQQFAKQLEISKIKLHENIKVATIIEPATIPREEISPNKEFIIFACIFIALLLKIAYISIRYANCDMNNNCKNYSRYPQKQIETL